jgi:hypothetical protein
MLAGFLITIAGLLVFSHYVPVPEWLGGVNPSKDGSLVCWEYPADKQKICIEQFETWFGQDVRPIYWIDAEGVKHPM